MKKNCLIFVFFFVSIFVHGQSIENIKLSVIGDSIIVKGKNLQFKVIIENRNKNWIFVYRNFISLIIYNKIDTVLHDCIVNSNGDKLFLHVIRRDNSITKLKPSNAYSSAIIDIDFNRLCWQKNIENEKIFYIQAEYYDVKKDKLFYSEPILVKKE